MRCQSGIQNVGPVSWSANRIIYAILGGIAGAIVGVLSWFYLWTEASSEGVTPPKIQHVVIGSGVLFAVLGLIMKSGVVDVIFDKRDDDLRDPSGWLKVVMLIFVAVCVVLWFTHRPG
jgi:hypothetical protein